MKTFKIFSTAALALMMAACSSEDAALNNSPAQQQGRKVHFTATIAAPGGNASTRTEYTEVTEGDAAGTINVAWKAKDEIALIHNGTKDVVTVETVNEDGSATITGDITVGTNGEAVIAYYPAAAIELNNDKNPVSAAAYTEKMLAQDGTLSYIASNLDLRVGESTIAVDGDKATLSDNVKLTSNTAIWKLTLQDNAETPAALSATQVSVKVDGETPVTIASTAKLSTATSTVYLAMPPMSESEATVTIEAVTANGTYIYENSGLTLAAGNYYQSTVTMAPAVTDLSKLTANYTAQDGDILTGTLGANVKISIADGATVTLDNVSINADGTWNRDNWAGLTCEGDATIILKDGSENTVKGFRANYPGIYVPENKKLTIKGETAGTGILTASSNGMGAGIGGGMMIGCGNIEIQGGVITAIGGGGGAGIGGANSSSCGTITISGGTITATGSSGAAGIGSGSYGTCVDIIITGGSVTATGGANAAGIGSGGGGTCGDILISGGTVSATGGTDAAGIGSGTGTEGCGAITISGGTVTATGGENAAGIGSGYEGKCTTITISGGTVTATGGNGNGGAGIGTGFDGKCGNIMITSGVTKVTAKKGNSATNSIGIGSGRNGSCGTVTIGGVNTGAISTSPYTYDPSAPVYTMAANATAGDVGKLICTDGHIHAYNADAACTKSRVAKIIYVGSSTGDATYNHGLALALADEGKMDWNNAKTACTNKNTSATVKSASWMLPSYDQWDKMKTAAGGYEALRDGFTSVGGSNLESDYYWSSKEYEIDPSNAWTFLFSNGSWGGFFKSMNSILVRACLAF